MTAVLGWDYGYYCVRQYCVHSCAAGVQALGPHIASLTSLQHLFLVRNPIGDAGAEALGPHIANLTSLQRLTLASSSIGDAGAEALRPHIASLTSLEPIDLAMCGGSVVMD